MFVVFEGIDGSGKTTISNLVAERLRAGGLAVKHLREGGKFVSNVSEAIRELGRDARNLELVPQAELLLYVARDLQLIEQVLRPALVESDVVIADRFLYTAEVLGRYGRHLSAEWTTKVVEAASGGLEPDLVILVDVDPALARARRRAAKLAAADKRPPARKGLSGVGLQHRLRRGYLERAATSPERWVVISNDEPLDDLVDKITALVEEARRAGVPHALRQFRAGGSRASGPAFARPPRSTSEARDAFLRWVELRAEREPRVAAYMLSGMAGAGVDEHRRALAERVPEAVLAGLAGLTDESSWELRERLQREHAGAVALTLHRIPGDDPRAAALRAALEREAPAEVAHSLERLDDPDAWGARDRLYDSVPEAVVVSLATIGSERAWEMRERWLRAARDQVRTSYEAARVAARSVIGLDDARAWRLRAEAWAAAPVSALASLEGLHGARSWQWRKDHLLRAPKVIMSTLRAMLDPEAWEMRRAVAADCKEALDSVSWLDAPEAWELREAHGSAWPSTAVKTLGPLAETPRGQALIERLLEAHPGNLSLLKHAAGVALGAHRTGAYRDE